MEKEISFVGLSFSPSGHKAVNGELAASIGMVPKNGELCPSKAIDDETTLPEGYEYLYTHSTESGSRLIAVNRGKNGFDTLFWRPESSTTANFTAIDDFAGVRDARSFGKLLVIASSEGLDYAYWTEAGYAMLDFRNPPVVEFGLQKAGALEMGKKYTMPSWMAESNSNQGYGEGAWATHPLSSTAISDMDSASNKIFSDFKTSIKSQIEAAGMFHSPFFVRYALRLNDGTHILPSPPALMLPSLLPPMLKADTTAAAGKDESLLSINSSTYQYFSLRCRVSNFLKKNYGPYVTAIDIFATENVPTFATTQSSVGGIVSYSSLVKSMNLAGPADRGRNPQTDTASRKYLSGSWSEDGDDYADRFVSESDLSASVWNITPNLSLIPSLLGLKEFRLIASIAINEASYYSDFNALSVCDTSAESIKRQPLLDADEADLMRRIAPKILSGENRLMAAGGELMQAQPWPLSASVAFCGNKADPAYLPVTVTAHSSGIDGDGYASTVSESVMSPRLSLQESFPHFIYSSDPENYKLTIWQGGNAYVLPMKKHPSLHGSYWLGDLESGLSPKAESLPQLFNQSTPPAKTPNRIWESTVSLPFSFSKAKEIGGGEILNIMPTLKTMSSGQFGQYRHYAFTSEGIWSLPNQEGGAPVRISSHKAKSTALVGTSIAYATEAGVFLLTGSQIERISDAMMGDGDFWLTNSEPVRMMLKNEKYDPVIPSFSTALSKGTLKAKGDMLYLDDGSEIQYVCNVPDKAWGMASKDNKAFIITRPIKLDDKLTRKAVISVTLTGPLSPSSTKIAVLGSDDLQHWRLIGSARDTAVTALRGTGARYFSIVASSALSQGQTISGCVIRY